MGFMDSVKAFLHSVTTEDHYALYGSPYGNSTAGGAVGHDAAASTSRLHELSSSQTHSPASSRNASSSNIAGYRPGLRSSSTNLSGVSGQEMQSFSSNGQPPLPSVDSLWERIVSFLEEEYPELEDSLNSGASSADLNEFEKDLAVGPLPVEVRQFYKIHDGQFRGGKPTGLLMGLTLLDVESIMEEYALWAKVAERVEKQQLSLHHQQQQLKDAPSSSSAQATREKLSNTYLMHQKSYPPGAVQPYYVHRGWVPVARDLFGNLIGLDLAPGPNGTRGQMILYGRDFDTKIVIASSFQELIFQFVTDLESGNYQIDKSESYGDNGFLDSSRIDDYMIGDEDEDNGELSFLDRDGVEFGKDQIGKLSYMEVLKRRALKRFGISRVDGFKTQFTPQRISKKMTQQSGGAAQNGNSPRAVSNLYNASDASELHKETLIDDPISVSSNKAEDRKTTTESSQSPKLVEKSNTEDAAKAPSASEGNEEIGSTADASTTVSQDKATSEEAQNKPDESQEIAL